MKHIKERGATGCMKTKEPPHPSKNTKAASIFIKIIEHHKKNIYSALIRSSTGFWGQTSSLFCYVCFGTIMLGVPRKRGAPPPCEPSSSYVIADFHMKKKHRDPK